MPKRTIRSQSSDSVVVANHSRQLAFLAQKYKKLLEEFEVLRATLIQITSLLVDTIVPAINHHTLALRSNGILSQDNTILTPIIDKDLSFFEDSQELFENLLTEFSPKDSAESEILEFLILPLI